MSIGQIGDSDYLKGYQNRCVVSRIIPAKHNVWIHLRTILLRTIEKIIVFAWSGRGLAVKPGRFGCGGRGREGGG